MVEILERVVVRRTRTEVEYTGTAMMYNGVQDKQALLNALDSNNFGGSVDIIPIKDVSDMYEYKATVYID